MYVCIHVASYTITLQFKWKISKKLTGKKVKYKKSIFEGLLGEAIF